MHVLDRGFGQLELNPAGGEEGTHNSRVASSDPFKSNKLPHVTVFDPIISPHHQRKSYRCATAKLLDAATLNVDSPSHRVVPPQGLFRGSGALPCENSKGEAAYG